MGVAAVLELSDFFAEERGNVRPFSRALRDVVHALDDHGVRYALVGAVAVGKLARARATGDIDIAISGRRGVKAALAEVADRVLPFSELDGGDLMTKFVHTETGTEIDVLVLGSPAGRAAVAEARPARIGRDLVAMIPPVEALLCLKLVAAVSPGRAPDKRLTDAADAMSLMMAHGERLDVAKLKAFFDGLTAVVRRKVRAKLAELIDEIEPRHGRR